MGTIDSLDAHKHMITSVNNEFDRKAEKVITSEIHIISGDGDI